MIVRLISAKSFIFIDKKCISSIKIDLLFFKKVYFNEKIGIS